MRTRFLIGALAALALASCANDAATVEKLSGRDYNTLTATIESAGSKTVVETGGNKVLWNAGEEISVFLDGTNYKFTSQNTEVTASAKFKGTPSLAGISSSNPVWALSPYKSGSKLSGEKLTFEIPATQKAVEGSFNPDAHFLAARSTSADINFRNVTGGLRFTLKQSGVTGITFKGNDNETLAGKAEVKFVSDTPQVDNVTSAVKSITLEAPTGGFKTGVWYYITTIPVQFKKGFTVDFEAGTKKASFTTNQSVTAGRGVYGSIAEIDKNLEFKEPHIGVESIELAPTKITLEEGQTKTIVATVLPEDATDKSIEWFSDKPDIASVDQNGVVTAVSAGSTYIMAITNDGYKYATCDVDVTAIEPSYEFRAVNLEGQNTTVEFGDVIHFKYNIKGAIANTFEIIPIDGRTGNPVIDGTSSHFKCTSSHSGSVEVRQEVENVAGVTRRYFSVTVRKDPTVGTEAFSDLSFNYRDDNGYSVTKNVRVAIAPSAAPNAFSYEPRFMISSKPYDISSGKYTYVMSNSASSHVAYLYVAFKNSNGAYAVPEKKSMMKHLSFTNSNPSVIELVEYLNNVDYGGVTSAKLTFKNPGVSKVTMRYEDYKGNVFTHSVEITVQKEFVWQTGDIASNSINPCPEESPFYLVVGKTVEIRAYNGSTRAPYSATDAAPIKWSSTNTSLATVSPTTGSSTTVTGKGGGMVEIKGTDSKGNTRSFWAYVYRPVESVTKKSKFIVGINSSITRTFAAGSDFTFSPANANPKGWSWQSSDTSLANVDDNGKVSVSAKKTGTATIQVKPSPPNTTWYDARDIQVVTWNAKCVASNNTDKNYLKEGDVFTPGSGTSAGPYQTVRKNQAFALRFQDVTNNVIKKQKGCYTYTLRQQSSTDLIKQIVVDSGTEGGAVAILVGSKTGTAIVEIKYSDDDNYFVGNIAIEVK